MCSWVCKVASVWTAGIHDACNWCLCTCPESVCEIIDMNMIQIHSVTIRGICNMNASLEVSYAVEKH